MQKFESNKEAFASQNFDPTAITITGVPEQHINAVKAFIELCVVHDAVNPEFQPDYNNPNQPKYENVCMPGSPSGVGFSCIGCDYWRARSVVGSRLVSESGEAVRHVAELCHDAYKDMMVYQRDIKQKKTGCVV